MHVHDLDLCLTVQILEDAPTVLSLGKLCGDHGYSYECASGQKTLFFLKGRQIQWNTENYVPIVVPGLSTGLASSSMSTSSTSVSHFAK